MTEKIFSVRDAKSQLSKLIAGVQDGEEIVIAHAGEPVARLIRWEPRKERISGIWKGRVKIHDNFDGFTSQDHVDWYGDE